MYSIINKQEKDIFEQVIIGDKKCINYEKTEKKNIAESQKTC